MRVGMYNKISAQKFGLLIMDEEDIAKKLNPCAAQSAQHARHDLEAEADEVDIFVRPNFVGDYKKDSLAVFVTKKHRNPIDMAKLEEELLSVEGKHVKIFAPVDISRYLIGVARGMKQQVLQLK